MSARYVLKQSSDEKFMWNLKAGNGEIILTSQRYTTKAAAQNGIASVRRHAPYDHYYERKTASDESPYFVLKAANGEVIGTSEMYATTSGRDQGIDSVKRNGPHAEVVDIT